MLRTSKTAPWNSCKIVIEESSREPGRSLSPGSPGKQLKSATAPQREGSDTQKVPRGLREQSDTHKVQNNIQKRFSFWPIPANVLASAESATPAARMKKCPTLCTCHAKRRFRLQNVPDAPRLPNTKMDIAPPRTSKMRPSEEPKLRRTSCASLRGRNAYGPSHKETFMRKTRWSTLI